MDFRIKAEENKAKYLDMLSTILLSDESEQILLGKGCTKRVVFICPFCGKQKEKEGRVAVRAGHSLCNQCVRSLNANICLLGTRVGKLFVYDIAPYRKAADGQRVSMVRAICDCGSDREFLAHSVKMGTSSSCGCLAIEKSKTRVGELSPTWNPNLTDEDRKRARSGITAWAKKVKTRDNFECQVCGSGDNLVAHHLNSYKDNKELRLQEENGVTLCRDCHTDFHVNFMGNYRVPCTSEDFEEYLMQV